MPESRTAKVTLRAQGDVFRCKVTVHAPHAARNFTPFAPVRAANTDRRGEDRIPHFPPFRVHIAAAPLALAVPAAAHEEPACDRECLIAMADGYLA